MCLLIFMFVWCVCLKNIPFCLWQCNEITKPRKKVVFFLIIDNSASVDAKNGYIDELCARQIVHIRI